MSRPATTRILVFQILREHGPLPISQIAKLLDMNINTVASSVHIAHARGLVHISGWSRNIGLRGKFGGIYSLGRGHDKKPPQIDAQREADQRYREKYKEVIRRRDNARRGRPVDPWLAILGAA